MPWEDIASDPEFQAQPYDVRQRVANNYFDANLADPDFHAAPADVQAQARSGFLNHAAITTATLRPRTPIAPAPDTGYGGIIGGAAEEGFGNIGTGIEQFAKGAVRAARRAVTGGAFNPNELEPSLEPHPNSFGARPVAEPLVEQGQQLQENSGVYGLPRFVGQFVGQTAPFVAAAAVPGAILPEVAKGATGVGRLAQLAGRAGVENAVGAGATAPTGQRATAAGTGALLGVAFSPAGMLADRTLPGDNPTEALPRGESPGPRPSAELPPDYNAAVEVTRNANVLPRIRPEPNAPGEPLQRPAFSKRETPNPFATQEEPTNGTSNVQTAPGRQSPEQEPNGPNAGTERGGQPAQEQRNAGRMGQTKTNGGEQAGQGVNPETMAAEAEFDQVPPEAAPQPALEPPTSPVAAPEPVKAAPAPPSPAEAQNAPSDPVAKLMAIQNAAGPAHARIPGAPYGDAAGVHLAFDPTVSNADLLKTYADLPDRKAAAADAVKAARASGDQDAIKAATAEFSTVGSAKQGLENTLRVRGLADEAGLPPGDASGGMESYMKQTGMSSPEFTQKMQDIRQRMSRRGATTAQEPANESSSKSETGPIYGHGEQPQRTGEAQGGGQEAASGQRGQGVRPQAGGEVARAQGEVAKPRSPINHLGEWLDRTNGQGTILGQISKMGGVRDHISELQRMAEGDTSVRPERVASPRGKWTVDELGEQLRESGRLPANSTPDDVLKFIESHSGSGAFGSTPRAVSRQRNIENADIEAEAARDADRKLIDDAKRTKNPLRPDQFAEAVKTVNRGSVPSEAIPAHELPDGSRVAIQGHEFKVRDRGEGIALEDDVVIHAGANEEIPVDKNGGIISKPKAEQKSDIFSQRQAELPKQPARATQSELFKPSQEQGVTSKAEAKVGKSEAPRNVPDWLDEEAKAGKKLLARRARGEKPKSGPLDPEEIKAAAAVGAQWIRKGYRDFKAWSGKMISDIGEHIRPHLQAIWERARGMRNSMWYSKMRDTLLSKLPGSGTAETLTEQIKGMARKGEFKSAELEESGLLPWLAEQKGKVTAKDVLDRLDENAIELREVTKTEQQPPEFEVGREIPPFDERGGTKYNLPDKVLLGGQNYREVLLTLPTKGDGEKGYQVKDSRTGARSAIYRDRSSAEAARGGNLQQQVVEVRHPLSAKDFHSSHFEEPNILAHVRLNDRTSPDGKRTLFVEEVQSDWHQKGRKLGYKNNTPQENFQTWGTRHGMSDSEIKAAWDKQYDDPQFSQYRTEQDEAMSDIARPPDAPFKKNWHELAMKRVLRMAADEGYDRVAWTTGEMQNERYDLSKQIQELAHWKEDDGRIGISAQSPPSAQYPKGQSVIDAQSYRPEELENLVGKDVAKRILDGEGESESEIYGENGTKTPPEGVKILRGQGLTVGGRGMKSFYDKILSSAVNEIGKKMGMGRVGTSEIRTVKGGEEMPYTGPGKPKWAPDEGKFETVHSIDLTPAARAKISGEPMTLYSGLPLKPAIEGAKDISKIAVRAFRNTSENLGHVRDVFSRNEAILKKTEAGREAANEAAQVLTDANALAGNWHMPLELNTRQLTGADRAWMRNPKNFAEPFESGGVKAVVSKAQAELGPKAAARIERFTQARADVDSAIGDEAIARGVKMTDPDLQTGFRVDEIAKAVNAAAKRANLVKVDVKGSDLLTPAGKLGLTKIKSALNLTDPIQNKEDLAKALGVDVADIYRENKRVPFQKIENHFTHRPSKEVVEALRKGPGDSVYEGLMNEAKASGLKPEDVVKSFWRSVNEQTYGPLERPRKAELPYQFKTADGKTINTWESDPIVEARQSVEAASHRLAMIKGYGQFEAVDRANEIANHLYDTAGKGQGGRVRDAFLDMWDQMNGNARFTVSNEVIGKAISFMQPLEQIARMAQLSGGAVSNNLSGWVPAAVRFGGLRTIKAMGEAAMDSISRKLGVRLKTAAEFDAVRGMGASMDDTLGNLGETEDVSGALRKVGDVVHGVTGFTGANHFINVYSARAAVMDFADAIHALRSGAPEGRLRQLLGRSGSEIREHLKTEYNWTDKEIDRLVQNGINYKDITKIASDPKAREPYLDLARVAQTSNAKGNVFRETPLTRRGILTSRGARLVTAYTSWVRSRGQQLSDNLAAAKRGNLMPLMRNLVGSAVAGALIGKARDWFTQRDHKDGTPFFVKLADYWFDAATFGMLGGAAEDAYWAAKLQDKPSFVSLAQWEWIGQALLGAPVAALKEGLKDGSWGAAARKYYTTMGKQTPAVKYLDAWMHGPIKQDEDASASRFPKGGGAAESAWRDLQAQINPTPAQRQHQQIARRQALRQQARALARISQ